MSNFNIGDTVKIVSGAMSTTRTILAEITGETKTQWIVTEDTKSRNERRFSKKSDNEIARPGSKPRNASPMNPGPRLRPAGD